MLSAVPKDSLAVARRDWRRYNLDDDLLWQCQVAHACGPNLTLQNSNSETAAALALARFHHHSVAIRMLEEKIESLNGRPASESLIICVLRTGVSADVDHGPAPPECHPASPMATAQYMHLYGRMSIMPTYAKALRQLVESRGGICALKRIALPDWPFLYAAVGPGIMFLFIYPAVQIYTMPLEPGTACPTLGIALTSRLWSVGSMWATRKP